MSSLLSVADQFWDLDRSRTALVTSPMIGQLGSLHDSLSLSAVSTAVPVSLRYAKIDLCNSMLNFNVDTVVPLSAKKRSRREEMFALRETIPLVKEITLHEFASSTHTGNCDWKALHYW